MPFRLAIITDIHYGAEYLTKRGSQALELTRRFVDFVNTTKPDAVIEMGDRISDVDHQTDVQLTEELMAVLDRIECPRYHINGNHDLKHLSLADTELLLGQPMSSQVVNLGDWDLVLWRADPAFHAGPPRQVRLTDDDFNWLQHTVGQAQRPQLIVSHIPISPHTTTGNFYFERAPLLAAYPEAPRVRAMLAQAKVPIVCLSGHVHWNTLTQDNAIFYLTQQSLTESFTTRGKATGAFGLIELDSQVSWQVFGNDPMKVDFTPRSDRWEPPMTTRPLDEVKEPS